MFSKIDVTDPPNAAPTEMEASINSEESGSIEKVNGIRIAMATGPPSPGSTPTQSPITVPRIMNMNCLSCSAAVRPRMRLSSIRRGSALAQIEFIDQPIADEAVRKIDIQQIGADERQD